MGARITVRRSRAARLGRFCGALSVPVFVLTALGHRFAFIPEESLLALISSGTMLALIACAFGAYALSDIWKSGDIGAGSAIMAIVYSVPGVVLFVVSVYALAVYPRLNDVTTDLDNPPEFLAMDNVSENLGNASPGQRQLQVTAYPDITARLYPVSIERVVEAVRVLAVEEDWNILGQDVPPDLVRSLSSRSATIAGLGGAQGPTGTEEGGTVDLTPIADALDISVGGTEDQVAQSGEAGALDLPDTNPEQGFEPRTAVFQLVARTYIFQFANYVVIRIGTTPDGTRVDLRSASTVGQHDLGQNARRVRNMLAALDSALQGERGEIQSAAQ